MGSGRDLKSNIKTLKAIAPQVIDADGDTLSPVFDTSGYASLTFILQAGALTDGDFTPTITEGDVVDDASAPTTITDGGAAAAGNLIGTIANATFADTESGVVKKIGYKTGNKRYVQLKLTAANTTSGGFISAIAVLGHPHHAPVP